MELPRVAAPTREQLPGNGTPRRTFGNERPQRLPTSTASTALLCCWGRARLLARFLPLPCLLCFRPSLGAFLLSLVLPVYLFLLLALLGPSPLWRHRVSRALPLRF